MSRKNFIQWKGTDVCIDLYCECGEHHHFDGEFLYGWKCLACGRCYTMGSEVSMTKIPQSELERDCCLIELGEASKRRGDG